MNPLLITINSYLDTLYPLPGRMIALYILAFAFVFVLVLVQFFILRREKAVFLLDTKLRQSVENDMFLINETIVQKNRIIEGMKYKETIYNNFFKSSCDAIVFIDEDKFIDCNKAALDIFGCESKAELVLKNPVMFSPEFQPGGASSSVLGKKYFDIALKNGSCHFEWLHCRLDATKFNADVVLTIMVTKGSVLQKVTIRDINKEKQAENALKKAKEDAEKASIAKSDFLAEMSHEIRTPINGIIGMTELVMDSMLNEHQADFVLAINSEASSLLHLVDEILDFSKIEAGQLELEKIDFNLCMMLEEFVRSFSIRASLKGLDFILYTDPGMPFMISGDPGRLRQILANLVGNALKFTDKGKISIFAEIDHESDETITVLFKVEDTGIGISKEKQKSIFENYTQAESSTTRIYGGTGLGTTIAMKLAKLMHGEIHVESTIGKGSTFRFNASFDKTDSIVSVSQIIRGIGKDENFNSEKKQLTKYSIPDNYSKINRMEILLVEDNSTNRQIIIQHIESAGFKVAIAENGQDAVDAFKKGKYELIIMDMHMPLMNGYEATKRIRELEESLELLKDGKRIPIIALTANAIKSDREKCFEAGVDAYETKPIQRQKLYEILERWLSVTILKPGLLVESNSDKSQLIPIDYQKALAEFDDDKEFFDELLNEFIANVDIQINEISLALIAKNAKIVADHAHSIKGGAANLLAHDLSFAAGELEKTGKKRTLENGQSQLEKLKYEFNRLKSYSENFT